MLIHEEAMNDQKYQQNRSIDNHQSFTNATLLITGGTGSFGHTVLKHFLTTDIGQIRIFSRDEKSRTICAMSFRSNTRRQPPR